MVFGIKTQNMTSGSPFRLLFFFALPLIAGNVSQQLYTIVDTTIAGRGVGAAAVIGITGYGNGIFWAEVIAWLGAAVLLMCAYYVSAVRLGKNKHM